MASNNQPETKVPTKAKSTCVSRPLLYRNQSQGLSLKQQPKTAHKKPPVRQDSTATSTLKIEPAHETPAKPESENFEIALAVKLFHYFESFFGNLNQDR